MQTIESVVRSADFLDTQTLLPHLHGAEIIVVDDASPDLTAEIVAAHKEYGHRLRLHRNERNIGAAGSRNRGAALAQSKVVLFLDSDDEMLPHHLFVCLAALNEGPNLGFVRTSAILDPRIDPSWRIRINNTLPSTLAIRRDVFEFLEGFPEDAVFRTTGGEDVVFTEVSGRFFQSLMIPMETILYRRSPGNALDRQMHRFSTPFTGAIVPETDAERELANVLPMAINSRMDKLRVKVGKFSLSVPFKT